MTTIPAFARRPSGLNGALPAVFDASWQGYTDLSPAQIAAFQAFPQDLVKYIGTRRWLTELSPITLPPDAGHPAIGGMVLDVGTTSQQKIAGVKQAIDNGTIVVPQGGFPFLAVNGVYMLSAADLTAVYGYVVRFVAATYAIAATLLAQVNATPQTVTTRAAVDAAFASYVVQ